MRHKIRLLYDGSAFCGWQIQNNAKTVQGELEKALGILLGSPVQVVGAGRTDSEVNAINYIAHFDTPDDVSVNAEQLCYKLNAMLPREMAIEEISPADEEFHARFGATSREYHYFIHFRKDPFCEKYSYRMRYPLDIEKMNRAAEVLLRYDDFTSFAKLNSNNKTNICHIKEALWTRAEDDADVLVFRICADRFLRNMVRAIVGTLVDVGRGRLTVEDFEHIVAARDLSLSSAGAPAVGLFLSNVRDGAVFE